MLVSVALSHALTRVSVARARAAGFEMLWLSQRPTRRATRERTFVIEAELRNRDTLPTRFRNLTVSHAPGLSIVGSPTEGEVPAQGNLRLTLKVTGHRVGFHGIHNLTLQTVRAPGLYTVPLSFSNPFVVEVLPASVDIGLLGAMGGRSRVFSASAKRGEKNGDGAELREIREHRPGDPYRRIAWKPSARRGRLLIIEKEEDQSDTVWLLLDASIDSSSGHPGCSALDSAIDRAAQTLQDHLARGDRVGLKILGTRTLKRVSPGRGPGQKARLLSALTLLTHTADADRSDWDEGDVAKKVLEHLGSIDARAAAIRHYESERIFELVSELIVRAPVSAEAPWSTSKMDQLLRRYLLCFGIQSPPRGVSDRHRVELELGRALLELAHTRKRPSLVYVFALPPHFDSPEMLSRSYSALIRARIETHFFPMFEPTSPKALEEAARPDHIKDLIVRDALSHRQRISAEDGIKQLGRIGVKIVPRENTRNIQRAVRFYCRPEASGSNAKGTKDPNSASI